VPLVAAVLAVGLVAAALAVTDTDGTRAAPPTAAPTDGDLPTPAPTAPQPTAPPAAPAPTEPPPVPDPSLPPVDPTPPRRVPTADEPLRVWIGGDSMWERPGPRLVSALAATAVVAPDLEFHYSTGLTRPDVLDWPTYASAEIARHDPELVLFSVGANDSQPLADAGVVHQPGSDGFVAVYEARTRELMTRLAADGREVWWVGLPIMRSDTYDARMRLLDDIHARVAAEVDGVTHVPTRALFADADGRYVETLPDPDGVPRSMRLRDGIHLSDAGAARLAAHLKDRIAEWWPLPEASS
jgi:uncharacterized protein